MIDKTFRPAFTVKAAPGVVKSAYYAKQNPVYKELSPKEVAQCRAAGLTVKPYTYKINLNTLK